MNLLTGSAASLYNLNILYIQFFINGYVYLKILLQIEEDNIPFWSPRLVGQGHEAFNLKTQGSNPAGIIFQAIITTVVNAALTRGTQGRHLDRLFLGGKYERTN